MWVYNRTLGSHLLFESGETEAYVVWIKTDDLGGGMGRSRSQKKENRSNKQSEFVPRSKAVRYTGEKKEMGVRIFTQKRFINFSNKWQVIHCIEHGIKLI